MKKFIIIIYFISFIRICLEVVGNILNLFKVIGSYEEKESIINNCKNNYTDRYTNNLYKFDCNNLYRYRLDRNNLSQIRMYSSVKVDKKYLEIIEKLNESKRWLSKFDFKDQLINTVENILKESKNISYLMSLGKIDIKILSEEITENILFLSWFMNIIEKRDFKVVCQEFNININKIVNDDKIAKEIIKVYKDIGNSKGLNNKNVNLEDIKNNDKLLDFILNLEESARIRNINIDDFDYSKFYKFYNYILFKKDEKLEELFNNVLLDIQDHFKDVMVNGFFNQKTTKKGRVKLVELGSVAYKNYLKRFLELNLGKLNQVICVLFFERKKEYNIILENNIKIINNSLNILLKKIIMKIFNKSIFSNLESRSLKMLNKIKEENIDEFKEIGKYDFEEYFSIFAQTDKMEKNVRMDKFKSSSGLFNIIENILYKENLDVKEKQILIENSVIEYDMKFFDNLLNSTDIDNVVLHEIYLKMKMEIERLIKEYTVNKMRKLKKELDLGSSKGKIISLLISIGVEESINFIFKQLLDLMKNSVEDGFKSSETSLCINMAERYIRLVKYYIKKKKIIISKNIRLDNNFMNSLNKEDAIILGETLLEIILINTKIFERDYVQSKDHTEIFIKTKSTFVNKLIISSVNITQLPMLIKPRKITKDNIYSPYIDPEIYHIYNPFDSVIKPKYNQRELSESSSILNTCVDYLNSVKFKINKEIFYFILEEWNDPESKLFKRLNNNLLITIDDSKEEKNKKISHNSKNLLLYNILSLAYLYRDHEFYLPMFCDFRGRLYTHNSILSYQGHDLSRALLLFVETEKINEKGKEILKIYFANLAGFDKMSWSDRLSKGEEMFNKYHTLLKQERKDFLDSISNVSEPFQLISIFRAMEIIFIEKKEEINNPILFDATCSGIQHLSAMTKEVDMAIQVNLIAKSENPELEPPQDFYIYALERIREALRKESNSVLSKINLTRKMIKRSVMTIPYNISLTGVGEHLMEHFTKVKDFENKKDIGFLVPKEGVLDGKEPILLNYKEFGQLTKIIYIVLTKEMPSLKLLGEYLDSLIDILVEFNLPIIWITPAGMVIKLSNVKMKNIKTKINLLKRGREKVTISLPTKTLNKQKLKSSLMPNLIHSLDACNIHLLIKALLENNINIPLYTIHDCFASTPNNMSNLEILIKLTFLSIYFEGQYLEKMHNNVIDQIKSFVKDDIFEKNGKKYIKHNNKEILLPEIPYSFIDTRTNPIFIEGLMKSKYFIS